MGSRHCGGLRGLLALSGCGTGEQPGAASPEEQAKAICTGFLEGNGVQQDEEQASMWWSRTSRAASCAMSTPCWI